MKRAIPAILLTTLLLFGSALSPAPATGLQRDLPLQKAPEGDPLAEPARLAAATTNLVWSTATLSEARMYFAAATAGTKALFAEATTVYPTPSNVVDIYDGTTGTWSASALSQARFGMAATAVGTKALFAGGAIDGGSTSATASSVVDIYDSTTDTWSTASLSQARYSLAATTVGSKALFAGGWRGALSNVVDIYDATTGDWSTATLSQARYDIAATAVGTKALFAGGYAGGATYFDVVDIYDGVTGTWSTARLSQARSSMGATTVGSKAFFAGGSSGVIPLINVVDIYDSTTGSWSTATLSQSHYKRHLL